MNTRIIPIIRTISCHQDPFKQSNRPFPTAVFKQLSESRIPDSLPNSSLPSDTLAPSALTPTATAPSAGAQLEEFFSTKDELHRQMAKALDCLRLTTPQLQGIKRFGRRKVEEVWCFCWRILELGKGVFYCFLVVAVVAVAVTAAALVVAAAGVVAFFLRVFVVIFPPYGQLLVSLVLGAELGVNSTRAWLVFLMCCKGRLWVKIHYNEQRNLCSADQGTPAMQRSISCRHLTT